MTIIQIKSCSNPIPEQFSSYSTLYRKDLKMKVQLQKRFGTIAVEKGFITQDQLFLALKIQAKENLEKDKHRLLGQILIEQGLLSVAQVEEILSVMNQQIVYMISAGR